MNEDFKLFQEEFRKWQRLFGLTGYQLFFRYEPLDDVHSSISIDQESMVATIRLNKRLSRYSQPDKDVERNAKHEALHLLVGRLVYYARSRYTNPAEITEAGEELVNKLMSFIG